MRFFHARLKKGEIQTHATTCTNLEGIKVSGILQPQKEKYHLHVTATEFLMKTT